MPTTEQTISFEEADALISALDRMGDRQAEYERDLSAAQSPTEAYWAGSAFQSAINDYRAGRTRVVKAAA